jgi:crotonobetainyl-CoA:carnitine CoA-transferase CaiB-like acyl-CoA transferase
MSAIQSNQSLPYSGIRVIEMTHMVMGAELKADEPIATNNQRVQARDWLLPQLRKHMEPFTAAEISTIFERIGCPTHRLHGRRICLTIRICLQPAGWPM